MVDQVALANDTPRSEASATVDFAGMHLSDADIREMELIRSRRPLAYLKDRIGNEATLELLADDLGKSTARAWDKEYPLETVSALLSLGRRTPKTFLHGVP